MKAFGARGTGPLLHAGALFVWAAAAQAAPAATASGSALLDDWQVEDALAVAATQLAKAPEDPEALYLAARVQHARGEHLSALYLLRAATGGAAGRDPANIVPRVEQSASYAEHFAYEQTVHFRIGYVDKDRILASYAAAVLEAAYARIGDALGLRPAERGEKIAVEIYPDARGLAGATGLTIEEIDTSGTIAVCKFHRLMVISPLATATGYGWADTMAHELAHLIISKASRDAVPVWLHEGIAKYFESTWRGAPGAGLSPYAENLLADAVAKDTLIPFAAMHPSMAKLPSQEQTALAFAQVFTVVEHLVAKHGQDSVRTLLARVGRGEAFDTALGAVYGKGLRGIDKDWRRYLKQRKFRRTPGAAPTRIVLARAASAPPSARPLETMAEKTVHSHARLGELLALRGHPRAALKEYEKAYAAGGLRYPTLVYRLAGSYVDAGRLQDGGALLDKVLRLHPEDVDLLALAGRTAVARKAWESARRHFEALRLINPFHPELHLGLAAAYRELGDNEAAAREEGLLELARSVRVPLRPRRLPERTGDTRLCVTDRRFGYARVDGGAQAAVPIWDLPVTPGSHTVSSVSPGGKESNKTIDVKGGERKVVVLDE